MAGIDERPLRVLVLDGGDIRCFSQMDILDEILHRYGWMTNSERSILPCEYFNIIVGVGRAGILVILLVVFRMSVEETREEFLRISNMVFVENKDTMKERSAKLERVFGELLDRWKFSKGCKLLDSTRDKRCQGFICVISPESPAVCQKFRTYAASERGIDVTILDALRTTSSPMDWAYPVEIGAAGQRQKFFSGETIFKNPIREVIKELHDFYGASQSLACLISVGCGKAMMLPAHSVTNKSLDIKLMKDTLSDQIAEDIEAQIGNHQVYYRFSVNHGLEASQEDIGIIKTHTHAYLQQAKIKQEIDNCVAASERISHVTLADIYHSQTKSVVVAHGLPPLCASFVGRSAILDAMSQSLFNNDTNPNRVTVLSGMGGSGKTQMASWFARVHPDRFKHVFFIDGSSVESLTSGIALVARLFGSELKALNDTLTFLNDHSHRNGPWLWILDNCDNPNIELAPFLPLSPYSYVIITTRNPALEFLSPKSHIKVDIMSEQEAVKALLKIIHPMEFNIPQEDRRMALEIVKELAYLPVAITQAGYFIKRTKGLDRYLVHLKKNRSRILQMPAKDQLDAHYHGIYAALDVTLSTLSYQAEQLLCLFACFHHTEFPYPLIGLAASRGFDFELIHLCDRGDDFRDACDLLSRILCVDGAWDELAFETVLMELEQLSMMTRVKTYGIWTLRFHPLIHAWMSDRLLEQARPQFENAALRLLLCATDEGDEHLYEFILPHLRPLSATCNQAHVNDLATIAKLARWLRKDHRDVQLWENIYTKLSIVRELRSIPMARAQMQLAMAYSFSEGPIGVIKAQVLIEDVCRYVATKLPGGDANRREAFTYRSQIYDLQGPNGAGVAIIQRDVIVFQHESLANCSRLFIGQIERPHREALYEARKLFSDLPQSREMLLSLASNPDNRLDSEQVLLKVIKIRVELQGEDHFDTIVAEASLARFYEENREFHAALMTRDLVVEKWKKKGREFYPHTLRATVALARLNHRRSQFYKAASQWREVLEGYQELYGAHHLLVWYTKKCLAEAHMAVGNYLDTRAELTTIPFREEEESFVWINVAATLLFITTFIKDMPPLEERVGYLERIKRFSQKPGWIGLVTSAWISNNRWISARRPQQRHADTPIEPRGEVEHFLRVHLRSEDVKESLLTAIHSVGLSMPQELPLSPLSYLAPSTTTMPSFLGWNASLFSPSLSPLPSLRPIARQHPQVQRQQDESLNLDQNPKL